MTEIPERIERLIVRRLDGEITDEERLELDRELLRRPEARELLASYERIDALATDVIDTCTRGSSRATPIFVVPQENAVAPRAAGRRWMIPVSAMAACLALVILWQTPPASEPGVSQPSSSSSIVRNGGTNNPQTPGSGVGMSVGMGGRTIPAVSAPVDGGIWSVTSAPPRRIDRSTERNLIVVPDGKGNFYLINVDRIREVQQPRNGTGIPSYRDPV